jgi:hypothetical protein
MSADAKDVEVEAIEVTPRVVAGVVKPDGSIDITHTGIEMMALPSLLRVAANDVERQLGIRDHA